MPKLPDDILLEVAGFCISYLSDRFSNERGLFRFAVSQTDVRQLQSQIAQKTITSRDEVDPHLIAEVLQTTFKDIESPLLLDVYQDILNTDPQQNEYTENKIIIQQWLQKLPEQKRSLMHSYFRLMSKLAAMEETDVSLMQLVYSISPTICRPLTSCFMSLRHKEDLNKIRPVVLFLIENFTDIFTFTKSFHVSSSAFGNMVIAQDARDAMLSDMMTSAMVIDSGNSAKSNSSGLEVRFISSDASGSEDDSSSSSSMPFIKPSLMLSIPTTAGNGTTSGTSSASSSLGTTLSFGSNSSGGGGSGDEYDALSLIDRNNTAVNRDIYSDSDWKIFHALVCNKVTRYLDFSERETQQYLQMEAEDEGYHAAMQAWTAKVSLSQQGSGSGNNKLADGMPPPISGGSSSSSSTASTTIGALGKKISPRNTVFAKSIGRRNRRRKMVAECKGLRQQIQDFEQAFLLQHSRMPKTQERGEMQAAYVKYRELKKEIRETAAKDMQRVARGFMARRLCARLAANIMSRSDDDGSTVQVVTMSEDYGLGTSNQQQYDANANKASGVRESSGGYVSSSSSVASFATNVSASSSALSPTHAGGVNQQLFSSSTSGGPPASLYNYRPTDGLVDEDLTKFRELSQAKRDLKRTLKKFDADFLEQHGRQPKKSDKEAMRPMYQKYQEIKTSIEILRVHLQNFEALLPEDLKGEVCGYSEGNGSNAAQRRSSMGNVYADSDAEMDEGDTPRRPSANSTPVSNPTAGVSVRASSISSNPSESQQQPQQQSSPTGVRVRLSLDELQLEKKHLHEYLKVYERDFNRTHGRPVMKNEDILPVAAEYQRYKELKNLIKDLKQ